MRGCERPGCREAARGRGRFCSDRCRWLAWDAKHPRKGRSDRRTTARRPTRDGLGEKVYLTRGEILALLHSWEGTHPPDDFYDDRDRAVAKLRRARDRIRQREETK